MLGVYFWCYDLWVCCVLVGYSGFAWFLCIAFRWLVLLLSVVWGLCLCFGRLGGMGLVFGVA